VITGTIRSQVDAIWNAFAAGGISNPLEVIEQMTYLLFIKRLDELETVKEKKANRLKREVEDPIFNSKPQKLRWSVFNQMGDAATMYDVVESRERFEQSFGKELPLTLLIRSLVGMDRTAAKEAFGRFPDENRHSSQQIRFVEMIIERLRRNGVVEPGQLYEPPFTGIHYEGLDGAFGDSDAQAIVEIVEEINLRAAA